MAAWDITLDGESYMVVPKSYRATTIREDATDDTTKRHAPAHPSVQLGEGSWPHPWPWRGYIGPAPARQSVSGTIEAATTRVVITTADETFIASNDELYTWSRSIGSAATSDITAGAAITCAARVGDAIFLGFGSSADVDAYTISSDVLQGAASALGEGVTASVLHEWARGLMVVSPVATSTLHYFHGNTLSAYKRSWKLAGRVISMTNHADRCIVVTDAGLYEVTGDWWQDLDPPAPEETLTLNAFAIQPGSLQGADDGRWILSFGGRLYGWFGGQVLRLDNLAGTWLPVGLQGAETHGAAVVNGWLIVSITSRLSSSNYELWAFDGDAWYLLDRVTTTNTLHAPAAAGDGLLVVFQSGGTAWAAYDVGDVLTAATLATPWTYITAPLDAGNGSTAKDWSAIGVELYRPDGLAVGSWSGSLDYSTDGGATWTTATAFTADSRQQSIEAALTVTAVRLLVRVVLTRTSGLPPLIASVWAEATTAGSSALRRRRWSFKCSASDVLINRAGASDTRSGDEIVDGLWSLWESGSTVAYVDPAGDPFSVRVLALDEGWDTPAGYDEVGRQSTIAITLEEV